MKLQPLYDRILLKRVESKEEQKKGGIIIPDTAKEKPMEGKVIAVGAGRVVKGQRIPLELKVGDTVLFGKYTGTEIKIDDVEHVIVKEDEVLGIIK